MSPAYPHRPCVALALGLLALFFSAGCGDDAAQQAAPAVKPAVKPAAKADAGNDAALVLPFVYTAVGKRDPFRSYLAEMAEANAGQGPTRKREETEQFEIDQYRLTGLITGTSQPKAMVEDPQSRGHVLHIGSRLGKNGGRVTHIASNAIIVVEETRDPTGKKVRLPITIKLPRTEFEDVVQK